MRIGIYPGSFDPLTYGHLDIIERANKISDKLIIAIGKNVAKNSLFSIEERIEIINNCCKDEQSNIEVISFDGLLVDYCRERGVSFIIKGLRTVTDFEFEIPMASINRKLASDIETIFLMASEENLFISSKFVREIASFRGDVTSLVPQVVQEKIQQKILQP